jgi:hypothetical protein
VGTGTLLLLGHRLGLVGGDAFGAAVELSFAAALATEALAV